MVTNFFHADAKRVMKYLEIDNLILAMSGLIANYLYPFLMPIKSFLILTIALVACDTITGIMAADKRGEKISSKGIRRTVQKIVAYFIAILLAEGMRIVFMREVQVPYFIALIIAIAEFKSNIENIEHVSGHSIWDMLKSKMKINEKG